MRSALIGDLRGARATSSPTSSSASCATCSPCMALGTDPVVERGGVRRRDQVLDPDHGVRSAWAPARSGSSGCWPCAWAWRPTRCSSSPSSACSRSRHPQPVAVVRRAPGGRRSSRSSSSSPPSCSARPTPTPFQAFGIALILLVWINYFSRVVVLAAAWAHTSPEARAIRDANRVADQMPEGPRIDLAAAAPGVRPASPPPASSPQARLRRRRRRDARARRPPPPPGLRFAVAAVPPPCVEPFARSGGGHACGRRRCRSVRGHGLLHSRCPRRSFHRSYDDGRRRQARACGRTWRHARRYPGAPARSVHPRVRPGARHACPRARGRPVQTPPSGRLRPTGASEDGLGRPRGRRRVWRCHRRRASTGATRLRQAGFAAGDRWPLHFVVQGDLHLVRRRSVPAWP